MRSAGYTSGHARRRSSVRPGQTLPAGRSVPATGHGHANPNVTTTSHTPLFLWWDGPAGSPDLRMHSPRFATGQVSQHVHNAGSRWRSRSVVVPRTHLRRHDRTRRSPSARPASSREVTGDPADQPDDVDDDRHPQPPGRGLPAGEPARSDGTGGGSGVAGRCASGGSNATTPATGSSGRISGRSRVTAASSPSVRAAYA